MKASLAGRCDEVLDLLKRSGPLSRRMVERHLNCSDKEAGAALMSLWVRRLIEADCGRTDSDTTYRLADTSTPSPNP